MNALAKKLLPLTLSVIAITSLFCVQPARADYIVTLQQVGANVVANGSGAFNLAGLTFNSGLTAATGGINAVVGQINVASLVAIDAYTGITGPASFGSGGFFSANTGSGPTVCETFFSGTRFLFVPDGYASGTLLSNSSSTWNNATFASLGVTPGTYVWSWGTGLPNQSFTLQIGPAGVPDGGSTVSLLGCALLGLVALRRKLSC